MKNYSSIEITCEEALALYPANTFKAADGNLEFDLPSGMTLDIDKGHIRVWAKWRIEDVQARRAAFALFPPKG